VLALPKPRDKQLSQKVEYVLTPVCVEQIVMNTAKFHCIVDDPDNPRKIACDEQSMIVILKQGMTLKSCTEVNIVTEKK
jgi:hypothetical protein